MQSHPEDPGSISATQAFSPWARVKSRVAKPTSSSMKEFFDPTVPHYSGNPNNLPAASAPQSKTVNQPVLTQTGLWWNVIDYAEGTFDSVDIFITVVSQGVFKYHTGPAVCFSHSREYDKACHEKSRWTLNRLWFRVLPKWVPKSGNDLGFFALPVPSSQSTVTGLRDSRVLFYNIKYVGKYSSREFWSFYES